MRLRALALVGIGMINSVIGIGCGYRIQIQRDRSEEAKKTCMDNAVKKFGSELKKREEKKTLTLLKIMDINRGMVLGRNEVDILSKRWEEAIKAVDYPGIEKGLKAALEVCGKGR